MKSIYGLIVALFFMVSCNNSGKSGQNDFSEENIPVEQAGDSLDITEDNAEKDLSELGFDLMLTEKLGDIKLEMPVKEVIGKLGEPDAKTESVLWGADGESHQTYTYNGKGIKLDIIGGEDSKKVVNMITITEPCQYKTLKGIGIGSTYESVKLAYKDLVDTELSNDDLVIAGSVYGGLVFGFSNKKVNSIFIGASAE